MFISAPAGLARFYSKILGDACGGLRQRIYQPWRGFFE
ncbi:hypothetical protein COO91_06264 [Nostoc flagelliforme CCNUN1]|uniref:Uncharacterized protein n=1 Tax=Nostoc flagelliforme CCNUN1 TaxID=2038116 RepID=A0A2K8SZR5_9NOSO|nr:hypothetical protein COO91_06264 [Nostoc flagelliforme CCNUN1]